MCVCVSGVTNVCFDRMSTECKTASLALELVINNFADCRIVAAALAETHSTVCYRVM